MVRHGVETGTWVVGLTALLFLTVIYSATMGAIHIPWREVAQIVASTLPGFTTTATASHQTIILQVRLPRIALGAAVGFALAAAGTVMQGFFRNPMADPSIIGVSTGAAAGAVAVIVAPIAIPFTLPIALPFSLPLAAFLGALAAGFGVYLLATQNGRTPVATLLLAGVAIQTFLGAVISFMLVHAGWELREAVYWLMGHLSDATWDKFWLATIVSLFCFAILYVFARDLNILLFGEEDAHALGIEVETTKRVLLAVSSIMTAAAVAVAGVIGFVGLIVPHGMRLLVGPDHRILLPTSALAGATFLVAADTLARAQPGQLPVGIVTAFIGAPFFLYLLRTREVTSL